MTDSERILAEMRRLVDEAKGAPELLAAMRALLDDEVVPARRASGDGVWHGMVGESPGMLELRALIEKFAAVAAPVLIQGESGTGKDVVARLLHQLGPRASKPFVAENCAAIPESLLESLLFGHKRGAFTGAFRDHPGHFVAADKGSLFLDEIGDMALTMQAKLLRTLQESEVRPLGGNKVVRFDVRVIAATNQDLAGLVREGRFREDLFYRLNVLELRVPPLRERGDDVLLLAQHFLDAAAVPDRPLRFGDDARAAILAASWPGNVRQLQNEMLRIAALSDGPVIGVDDLSVELRG